MLAYLTIIKGLLILSELPPEPNQKRKPLTDRLSKVSANNFSYSSLTPGMIKNYAVSASRSNKFLTATNSWLRQSAYCHISSSIYPLAAPR